MGYKLGHKRENVAKATAKGQGKKLDKIPGGKGNRSNAPKIHVNNKLK